MQLSTTNLSNKIYTICGVDQTFPKNGHGAFLALIAQHAGQDKWKVEVKKPDDFFYKNGKEVAPSCWTIFAPNTTWPSSSLRLPMQMVFRTSSLLIIRELATHWMPLNNRT